jgi:LL-diaminopimelate aminotransferase
MRISFPSASAPQPLAPVVIEAMHKAVDEMAHMETFRGYGPEQGYLFLREAIAKHDFQARGCDISPDEIFVSDGAKCDTGNMQEIFAESDIVAVTDPVCRQQCHGRTERQVRSRFL